MDTIDPYLVQLAGAVARQLRDEGASVRVEGLHHRMAVRILRDDQENQGLCLSAWTYGRQLPQKVEVSGLWPVFQDKEQYPYGDARPHVSVGYGRDVHKAARDIVRRFMPPYTKVWESMLASVVAMRDRHRHRDAFLDQLRALPGVVVRYQHDSDVYLDLPEVDGEHRSISFTTYGSGSLSLQRGTITEQDLITALNAILGTVPLVRGTRTAQGGPEWVDQVQDPVATYRRQRRQYKTTLLFVRDVDSYVTLYRDAEQVAELLQKSYDGVSPLRVAPPLFESIAFNLVKSGLSVAVLFAPEALDRNAARQVDLYDLLQNEQLNDDVEEGTEQPQGGARITVEAARPGAGVRRTNRRGAQTPGPHEEGEPVHRPGAGARTRLAMATEREHTIRVRYANGTHQAVDDRSWVKCSSTSGHEQAAFNLLRKQGITDAQLQRLHQREQHMRDPKRPVHEQWRMYKVVRTVSTSGSPKRLAKAATSTSKR